jgi:hypothetical protein
LQYIAARKKKLALANVIDVYLNEEHLNNPSPALYFTALSVETKQSDSSEANVTRPSLFARLIR